MIRLTRMANSLIHINDGHFVRTIIIVRIIQCSELELSIYSKSIEIRVGQFGNSLKKAFGIYGADLALV
jgi:hypothetical protein